MLRRESSVEVFKKTLAEKRIAAVSFDVFDTLITRTYAQPTDLFVDLGERLRNAGLITLQPPRFGRLRVQAESSARLARDDHEPSLQEIYVELSRRVNWSEAQTKQALQAELDLEQQSCRANPQAAAYLIAARELGLPIAFVSDMYLPSGFIRQMLEHHGLATPADLVLVSNEHRTSKAAGGLFKKLEQALQKPLATILHVGDNEEADGASPLRLGLSIFPVVTTHLGAVEKLHLPFSPELGGLPGKISAASRNGRLNVASSASNMGLCTLGAGLLGPMLTAFAFWTFARAEAAGLKRLYFVSRDGQVMREIALAVQQRVPRFQSIECRYIYGSRIAWHHSALESLDSRQLRWLMDPQPTINAQVFAQRLGADRAVVEKCLHDAQAGHLAISPSWNENEVAAAKKIFIVNQDVLLQSANADKRRALGRAYFEQEGLLDDVPWGLVELGWSGSMLSSLCYSLQRKTVLPAFYFCQSHDDPSLPTLVALESFLMRPAGSQWHFGRALRLSEIIEALTAADHPTVLGYREDGARIGPIFKTGTIPMWPADHLRSLRIGANGFIQALDTDALERFQTWTADEVSARLFAIELLSVLCRFVEEPSRELALPFTECVFSEDPAEQNRRTFVAPVSLWKALKERVFTSDDLWPQGSLACSHGFIKALVTGGFGYAFEHAFRQVRNRWSPFR